MKGFVKDFKEFVLRGNVIDLAVAVVLGAAFKAIIDAIVNNIFSPVIGMITGGLALDQLTLQVGEVTFQYGVLIMAVINFILIALLLFIVIRVISRLRKAKEEEPTPDTPEVEILKEIRELLKSQQK
ncbi:MAG: large conductance mechanosensitive channel protein MscL [Culicoidibacterales bacterium]